MIRERCSQGLDRLCAIVAGLVCPGSSMLGGDPRAWLEMDAAEQSWVYDMAPVHVTPTKNVVGHVQICRPTGTSSTPGLAERTRRPVSELLAIGRFLVEPQTHDYGIARHLLTESRTYVERQGKTPVLDLRANTYLTKEFCEKYGFVALSSDSPDVAPMIFTG